jgi:xylan 1,4-beta-xylosidase
VAGPSAEVSLAIEGLGVRNGRVKLQHFRVDAEHSNAYTVWQRMGSPEKPSTAQYAQMEKASVLEALPGPSSVDVANGRATIPFTLPRQGVSLLVVEW